MEHAMEHAFEGKKLYGKGAIQPLGCCCDDFDGHAGAVGGVFEYKRRVVRSKGPILCRDSDLRFYRGRYGQYTNGEQNQSRAEPRLRILKKTDFAHFCFLDGT
ncbi:hypothetical protein [Ascidiaceihabitans sp.]|uniref:hypothetical protein n=1 Tax=Ascidiaceihabitans sp. TaxID=1872644 RepID=UPI0032976788